MPWKDRRLGFGVCLEGAGGVVIHRCRMGRRRGQVGERSWKGKGCDSFARVPPVSRLVYRIFTGESVDILLSDALALRVPDSTIIRRKHPPIDRSVLRLSAVD